MGVELDTLIRCGQLVTCAPGAQPRAGAAAGDLGVLHPGAMGLADGRVAWTGTLEASRELRARTVLERPRACVVPGLIDAHTHPVYAGSRVHEFAMRARGATYLEIHQAGGGILSTVQATRQADEAAMVERTARILERMRAHGATTVEAKSGYGLDEATEVRDLRVIREAARRLALDVIPTFLGAHAIPPEYADRRAAYVDLLVERMIPRVAAERLAEACDVFCEEGAFTLEESERILRAAQAHGLAVKAHAEEFEYLGGARMAASLGALSVDHLLSLPSADFGALREAGTVAVLLPATTLFLGKTAYAPARGLVDAGVPVAIATDFNAGSCMTESLPAALALSVMQMKLTPEEAVLAGTVNAAHALGRGHDRGSLEPGRRADFLVLEVDDYREWLYHFGVNLVAEVWIEGRRVVGGVGENQAKEPVQHAG